MPPEKPPIGDPAREAIDSLRGYVYQIYQSALAWTEIKGDEFLYLEVAEDYAVAAANALEAVQVKDTAGRVTINSDDIVASIDSFVELQEKNPSIKVSLRHLTTSEIGKEKSPKHRIGDTPTLISWRNLAKLGEPSELRDVLDQSKISKKSKKYIKDLNDTDLREKFLKRIHFDCGAPDSRFLSQQLDNRISELVLASGGLNSQAIGCTARILLTLLKLSTNKNRDERYVNRSGLEKHIEEATHLPVNRARFEAQNRLMEKALLASVSSGTDLTSSRIAKPTPISEIPLPRALANRHEQSRQLLQSLERAGICWICGAAGMGKTVAARVLAHKNEGNWANINLRNQTCEQVTYVLAESASALSKLGLQGLIVDDLDCAMEPSVLESLHYLAHSANRLDVLLIVTSSHPPTSDFLFVSNMSADIAVTLTEFTEADIGEVLNQIGVSSTNWAKYTHLVSGGGHPQLVIAFIQSMAASGWNSEEFQTLNALLSGSPAVNEVRKRTRERLLNDLPDASRRLIERLSLKAGSFSRELAVDLGKVAPPIQNVGTVLDALIGSWVDQNEGDKFDLSPLLSDYAAKTLARDEKIIFQSAIAESLTKGRILDVSDMNSALLAAWSSQNKAVILKLCMAVLASNDDELEMLAPHLPMFTLSRTDTAAYPDDAAISHMFRGVQLLLVNLESESSSKLREVLVCFTNEAENVKDGAMGATMNLMIYSKLLLQTSKAGLGVEFIDIISKLDRLLDNIDCAIPIEALEGFGEFEREGITPIGFMFLSQAGQLTKIEELTAVFDFLDASSNEQRLKLLAPFELEDFEFDMLVTGAWLREHENETIDSETHSAIFARLEKQAASWENTHLAICCRKYQAIILDEYGGDKESALEVLDEGLGQYGPTNSDLVRAKAKVLYRSEDHKGSLALSKSLIESDAPLNEVEKAFLGRDAAISAEKEGDLETARRYYLYGSDAAKKSSLPDMAAMRVGLLADAALASWHDGDRLTCLQDFVVVLSELNGFKPEETLRTNHCHAVTRHVLLWLDQDATGEQRLLEDGEEAKIFPGCVSNPEPHPNIGTRFITPIEMAWYMLATVENHAALDAGITNSLEHFLPRGSVLGGHILLGSAKMHKAFTRLDSNLFISAMKDTVSYFAFVQANGERSWGYDIKDVTYGNFPLATKDQQENLESLTEQFVLLFCANCLFKGNTSEIDSFVREIAGTSGFSVRHELLDRLQCDGPTRDSLTDFAQLLLSESPNSANGQQGTPRQVFELAFKTLQMAKQTRNYRLFAENLMPWLEQRWQFVWDRQRFMLSSPLQHENAIKTAFELEGVSAQTKVAEILSAILPTLGIGNHSELSTTISGLPRH